MNEKPDKLGKYLPTQSIDACFYGNESRFINHSCNPNVRAIEIVTTNPNGDSISKIGIFSIKCIQQSNEIVLDYNWDTELLDIPEDVPCLCNEKNCRGFLMLS